MPVMLNLKGQRFGRLIAIEPTIKRAHSYIVWLCRCDCGALIEVNSYQLKSGKTRSCGCLQKETRQENGKANIIHGDRGSGRPTRLYRIWIGIKNRCYNPNEPMFKYYGGKGIKVCDEWKNNYLAFKAWALANGYRDDLTIDRINPDGNYCPENCRWLPLSENVRNGNLERKKRRQKNGN